MILNKDKIFTPKSRLVFPVNVNIYHKSTDGRRLHETSVKNMCLKEYGLYSYVRWLIGSFHNSSLVDNGQYVPQYLAVGSNTAPLNGAPNTDTAVKITDVSLFHELDDTSVTGEPASKNRIPLNRANYIEDVENQNWLKVQYEAYIPEDRFVNETIGELALMTMPTGWNAYARVTGFEPFVKVPNSVVQVIWEITIISVESSERFVPPIKTYLREAIEKAINVLDVYTTDPDGLNNARVHLDALIQPATTMGTGLWYLLNENEQITQDAINNYLSKPFNSLEDTGLIPLINKFDPDWLPSGPIIT
nr:MAG TPA: hypothetical protein [Caudoviricetes sp.]